MLKEYSLIPDIFDHTQYSSEVICGLQLNNIKCLVMHEGIASNLCYGAWSKYLHTNKERFHKAGIELIKSLRTGNRLTRRPQSGGAVPATDVEWTIEALSSHTSNSLDGILVAHSNAQNFLEQQIVSSIETLESCDWWNNRSESVRLLRRTIDYKNVLKLLLKNANSLMFIDPHLDITRSGYSEFHEMLLAAERSNHNLNPKIEIHRVCYYGSGPKKVIESNQNWETSFKRVLSPILQPKGLKVEVFIWDNFHDRYLISNLIGISIPNGYDVTTDPNDFTTWTRLSIKTADDIQREFDPASNRHQVKHRFIIP
jgi:hypothetical protein